LEWERDAPLLAYGKKLDEPALSATGGASGAARLCDMSFPLLPRIPCAESSTVKILDFVHAIVVYPAVVWAPHNSWMAVVAVIEVLLSANFSIQSLVEVLRLPAVQEERLLRGAVACLDSGLESVARLRQLLAGVLNGLKERVTA